MSNRNLNIDLVRGLAVILVFFAHYSFGFTLSENTHMYPYAVHFASLLGRYGVTMFFVISGYLAYVSLEKYGSTITFYRKRFIRLLLTYNLTYLIMSAFFITLLILIPTIEIYIPLLDTILYTRNYVDYLPTLFAIDGISIAHFSGKYFNTLFFIGEWFIGTIVFLLLLSPLFYLAIARLKGLRLFLFLGVILAIAIVTYILTEDLINANTGLFVARAPEFIFGMLLFKYQNFFQAKLKYIILMFFLVTIYITSFEWPSGMPLGLALIPQNRYFHVSLLTTIPFAIILFYLPCHKLNLSLQKGIVSFAQISFVFMLIHHVILNLFMTNYDITHVNKLGFLFFVILLFGITYIMSVYIHKITSYRFKKQS